MNVNSCFSASDSASWFIGFIAAAFALWALIDDKRFLKFFIGASLILSIIGSMVSILCIDSYFKFLPYILMIDLGVLFFTVLLLLSSKEPGVSGSPKVVETPIMTIRNYNKWKKY
jgi:Na+/citrate or Na+/malate symporter